MSRLKLSWEVIRSSLWFLPSLLTIGACGLAALTIWIDRDQIIALDRSLFILTSGAEGARGVLSTIAGSIITVTGVVFSITIVVLQLASSQYTPRVLRSFTEDRRNQLVLGVFIGTFTYSLLVLRTVRSSFDEYDRFVPSFSVNVAVVLALISIGFLIYFINHIAQSIQAETIIQRVTHNALDIVDALFPDEIGEDAAEVAPSGAADRFRPVQSVAAATSGFLQGVDEDRIMKIAKENDVVLKMEHRIGSFVIKGDPLVTVLAAQADPVADEEVRGAFGIGAERTRRQDIERSLIELTDIAVRALSPGVNDPTTALVCIHRLTEIFVALGERRFPSLERTDEDGNVRVIAQRVGLDELLVLSFGQIHHHGRENPRIMDGLREAMQRLAERMPAHRRHFVRVAAARLES